MEFIIKPPGVFIGIYNDSFDYRNLGKSQIRRASYVEPDETGHWFVDLSPVDGPTLGPFDKRNEAIEVELEFLNLMLSNNEPLDESI